MHDRISTARHPARPASQGGGAANGISAGSHVYCLDGRRRVGRVVGTTNGGDLVIQGGWRKPGRRLVSPSQVCERGRNHVRLSLPEAEFRRLPRYLVDSELQELVEEETRASLGPHLLEPAVLTTEVREGVVHLCGRLPFETDHRRLVQRLRALPEVRRVEDELVSDEDLRNRVALAFLGHPALQPSRVHVEVRRGVVRLQGELDDKADLRLSEELAQQTRGVATVENQLRLSPRGVARELEARLRGRLDELELAHLRIQPTEWGVRLSGHVRDSSVHQTVLGEAGWLLPLDRLEDRLASDDEVVARVAQGLASEHRLAGCKIEVTAELGRVYLRGTVPNAEAAALAVGMAEAQKDVLGVESRLRISPPRSDDRSGTGQPRGEPNVPARPGAGAG